VPFVANMSNNEEQDPNSIPQGAVSPTGGGGGAVHLSPASAVPTVGGGTGAASKTSTPGGQFATLNQYLTANQGQADPLANKLTAGINQQYNTLQGQNTSTLGGINNQVSANATPNNANDIIAQETANPVSFANNPSNIASFQKLLNASYSGPASAESTPDFTAQQNTINSAIDTGQQATQTEAGRENLLSQNEATPTTGVTALNSAILSQSPTALGNVESAYQPFSGLLSGLSSGAADIDKQIAQNQTNAQQANQTSNAALTGQVNALNNSLTSTANQDFAAQDKYNQALQQFQNAYNPVSTDINSLNELIPQTLGTGTPLVTNPFAPILQSPVSNVAYTPQGVATADQATQAQAFQALLNGMNLGLPTPITTQAGTLSAPPTFVQPDTKALAQQVWNEQNNAAKPANWTNSPSQVYGVNGVGPWSHIQPAFQTLIQALNNMGANGYPVQ
jgi:hypothetical protein